MGKSAKYYIGLAIIVSFVTIALLAQMIAPFDAYQSDIDMLALPTSTHWFGTDDLGRDVLSRTLIGSQSSLAIGICGAVAALVIGVPIGLIAGYYRGLVDSVVVPVIDLFIALPALILALIITAVVGPSVQNLIMVLGAVMWPPVARLVRGQVFVIREMTYVEAAVSIGGSSGWIIRTHVLPNVARVIGSQFAVTVSFAIFTSASLSFLGQGVPPPTPDWGGLVRAGFEYLSINPWMSIAPGLAVTITAMGFYLVGSSLR